MFSLTCESHVTNLQQRIRDAGLMLRRKKCQFAMAQCVSWTCYGRVCPEQVKVAAIQRFQQPQTKTQVRRPHRVLQKVLQNYSSVAAPLSDLTKKSQPNKVDWTLECTIAFEKLKLTLCASPVLVSPDYTKTFILQTDASDNGVGVVLSKLNDQGEDKPIAYYSRKLLPRQRNYSTVERVLGNKAGSRGFPPVPHRACIHC